MRPGVDDAGGRGEGGRGGLCGGMRPGVDDAGGRGEGGRG